MKTLNDLILAILEARASGKTRRASNLRTTLITNCKHYGINPAWLMAHHSVPENALQIVHP